MGKKLNVLFGRSSKTAAKLRMLANLAISRIAVLKNIHSVKCFQAQSDVIQLLHLGQQERALLRVEHVIQEQDLLGAFFLIENFCHILGEHAEMVKNSRECPDELKEAISSLIFASARCGEFPELQKLRAFFTSKYGKEFATSAIEFRNNCGVHPKMAERLSSRQASLESRQNLLKQIAKHNGITLQLDDDDDDDDDEASFDISKEKVISRKVYYDGVVAAAQGAFQSAAYAVVAPKAAVERTIKT